MTRPLALSLLGLCVVAALIINITQFSSTQEKGGSPVVETDNPATVAALPTDPIQFPKIPVMREDPTEACADCHPDHVEGFKQTGMGKSLYVMNAKTISEPWTIQASETKHPTSHLTYRAFQTDDGRFWQEETLPGTR